MRISKELAAVLTILKAHPEFYERFQSHIDTEKECINWDSIIRCAVGCSGSEYARLAWAFGIWNNESHPRLDVFSLSQSLDYNSRRALIKALAKNLGVEDVLNEKS